MCRPSGGGGAHQAGAGPWLCSDGNRCRRPQPLLWHPRRPGGCCDHPQQLPEAAIPGQPDAAGACGGRFSHHGALHASHVCRCGSWGACDAAAQLPVVTHAPLTLPPQPSTATIPDLSLQSRPLYLAGVSSGAAFALKLPMALGRPVAGVISGARCRSAGRLGHSSVVPPTGSTRMHVRHAHSRANLQAFAAHSTRLALNPVQRCWACCRVHGTWTRWAPTIRPPCLCPCPATSRQQTASSRWAAYIHRIVVQHLPIYRCRSWVAGMQHCCGWHGSSSIRAAGCKLGRSTLLTCPLMSCYARCAGHGPAEEVQRAHRHGPGELAKAWLVQVLGGLARRQGRAVVHSSCRCRSPHGWGVAPRFPPLCFCILLLNAMASPGAGLQPAAQPGLHLQPLRAHFAQRVCQGEALGLSRPGVVPRAGRWHSPHLGRLNTALRPHVSHGA